ncbi:MULTISPECIES: spondin domain-containing protein [unclassified Pseudoalteromonas]|uniref:spondin domain-containing protein n=1 Tax=unclassified Pseudoalteromonas TaxID=194690 RepID=UPI0020969991|nr:spondin domain-containing protein [Pseudoalteromonas sp. XMcav2-N]MCO7189121.1 spondin domain-containing protein [Pseudoalteromonas sp. XMcav2-N]
MNIASIPFYAFVLFTLSACGGGGGGEPSSTSNTVNTEASDTTSTNTQNNTDTSSDSDISGNDSTDANNGDQAAETVTYQLTFTRTWESDNFPTNFPGNSHFSPLVGLTHNQDGFIFKPSTTASAGMISMAETGSKTALKDEISTIQNAGHSNYLIDESGVSGSAKSVTFTFEASQQFPLLSVVSMVAPSPDWFIGLESFPLFTDNQWIDSQTIQLKVYDAGSDSGPRFSSTNQATSPAEPIMLLTSDPSDSDFSQGVHAQSGDYIGMIEIKRL